MEITLPISKKKVVLKYTYGIERAIENVMYENMSLDVSTKGTQSTTSTITGKALKDAEKKALELIPQGITYDEILELDPKDGRFLLQKINEFTDKVKKKI